MSASSLPVPVGRQGGTSGRALVAEQAVLPESPASSTGPREVQSVGQPEVERSGGQAEVERRMSVVRQAVAVAKKVEPTARLESRENRMRRSVIGGMEVQDLVVAEDVRVRPMIEGRVEVVGTEGVARTHSVADEERLDVQFEAVGQSSHILECSQREEGPQALTLEEQQVPRQGEQLAGEQSTEVEDVEDTREHSAVKESTLKNAVTEENRMKLEVSEEEETVEDPVTEAQIQVVVQSSLRQEALQREEDMERRQGEEIYEESTELENLDAMQYEDVTPAEVGEEAQEVEEDTEAAAAGASGTKGNTSNI